MIEVAIDFVIVGRLVGSSGTDAEFTTQLVIRRGEQRNLVLLELGIAVLCRSNGGGEHVEVHGLPERVSESALFVLPFRQVVQLQELRVRSQLRWTVRSTIHYEGYA